MKFKDKDGNVFEDIEKARRLHCKQVRCGLYGNCPLFPSVNTKNCLKWCTTHPTEAARLMGYEVVEEEKTCDTCVHNPPSSGDGKPCSMCDTSNPMLNCYQKKEADMEKVNDAAGDREAGLGHKQRPRICEVLGVEVGESFNIGAASGFQITEDGEFKGGNVAALCFVINHPGTIIRQPRFTEEEVADARAIVRLFGPNGWTHIGKTEDGYPRLEDKDEEREEVMMYAGLSSGLFPSLLPGTSVSLKEIIGEA